MVRCPRGTLSQVKANLAYINRPTGFDTDSSVFSWVYDPIKGEMVRNRDKENEAFQSEMEELYLSPCKKYRKYKKGPSTAREELVYIFLSCFLDVLAQKWDRNLCLQSKPTGSTTNESEFSGEDLGPCDPSPATSLEAYLNEYYRRRTINLSKEKVLVVRRWSSRLNSEEEGEPSFTALNCYLKRSSESTEIEVGTEGEFESSEFSDPLKGYAPDEDVYFLFGNGTWYEGQVSWKLMDGEGIFFWEDGAIYQGGFEKGCATGKGRLEFPDLSVYEGGVYKAFRHGVGMHCFSESPVMYSGEWWLGKKHGYGLLIYSDPSKSHNFYKGHWENGMKEGFGFRQYPSGAKYIGFWSKDKRCGKGVMIWNNKDIYRGQWKDGLMNGYGEYTWEGFMNKTLSYPAHNVYRGNWMDGKRSGHGVLELKNGAAIETVWGKNLKEGMGAVVCENGVVIAANNLFFKDKQAFFENHSGDLIGTELRDQAARGQQRNDEQLSLYLSNVERAQCISIPILSPVHTLSLYSHSEKFFKQKLNEVNMEMENAYLISDVKSMTPEKKSPEERLLAISSEFLTDEEYCMLSKCAMREEKHLRNCIIMNMAPLRRCYDYYARLGRGKSDSVPCVLLRIFLWQMLLDGDVPETSLSLVDIDELVAKEEGLLIEEHNKHNPFERLAFWQFIQILVTLSWNIYGCYVLGNPPPVEREKVKKFLDYFETRDFKLVLKTSFEYFIENDIFRGRFLDDSPPPSVEKKFEDSDYAPMEAIYTIYKNVGEPHSIRDFLRAVCSKETENPEKPPIVRYFEKLPFYKIDGTNAMTIGGELAHLPKSQGFNNPEMFELERNQIPNSPRSELTFFYGLKAKRVFQCLVEVCPSIMCDGCVVNLDYKLTFLEFYKAIVLCAKLQLKMKIMNDLRENILAEYKIQLEEYKRQMAEYEKLKEGAALSRKKSRQFSDKSKRNKK